jgi:hypothetical protein
MDFFCFFSIVEILASTFYFFCFAFNSIVVTFLPAPLHNGFGHYMACGRNTELASHSLDYHYFSYAKSFKVFGSASRIPSFITTPQTNSE